jgi:2-polyprenyl-6-methoxyphenol hydroxylase-like FAD-dependent oxidoreductase
LKLTQFEQEGGRVRVRFADRQSSSELVDEADILVGADGIHSAVRHQLYPAEGEPRFAQQMLWRAAAEAQPFLDGQTMVIAGHFHQRIIVYPIGKTPDGQALINWICQKTVLDRAPLREDWNRRVPKEEVLAAFGGWKFPWLDLPALIERSPHIYEFPLVDRDPVAAWSFGRVTLLGDAAHPMQPIGGQAGSQAIVDARALTRALSQACDPAAALLRYDGERRPAMNDIILRNRNLGPEAAMQIAEERAPNGFARINDVISPPELDAIVASFATAAGLDVETVNARSSYVSQSPTPSSTANEELA